MILYLLFIALNSFAQTNYSHVTFDQFQMGNHWTWTYSSRDTTTGVWTPYLSERYTVTEIVDSKITLEMSSSSFPYNSTEAHHKMIVDFKKCEQAAKQPAFKNFTIAFYTKNLGKGWQIVSQNHKNLPFTEKFNCAGPLGSEISFDTDLLLGNANHKVFQLQSKEPNEASWYFLTREALVGVAAYKLFIPDSDYKSEFEEFCNAGLACLN